MTSDIVTYGRIAYERYAAHSGGISLVSGDQLPAWNDQKPSVQRAWIDAGNAVADSILDDGTAPPGFAAATAETRYLRTLVAEILQSLPDTADEQEWRDRAGALGVTDPDGQPYRAYTGDGL